MKLKRFLAGVLTAAMVLTSLPVTAFAEDVNSVAEAPAADETAGNITVSTVDELLAFAKAVNGGESYAGKTVTLGADIDLTGTLWEGIGVYNDSEIGTAFQGTFDGNGKKISNVTFKNTSSNKYRGFFNQLYNATVKNLTVECNGFESSVSASASASYGGAAIAGHAINSTIQNCVSEGKINGTHNVAGIVVRIEGSTIKDCINKANLTNTYTKLGGIVNLSQHNAITENKQSLIQGCVNEGNLTNTYTDTAPEGRGTGGIIGWVGYSGDESTSGHLTIEKCENKGTIVGATAIKVGQLIGACESHLTVLGGNKGLKTQYIQGNQGGNVPHFATVEGNVATYTGTLAAGNTYLVVVADPTSITQLNLENGQSISFDTTLSNKGPVVNVTGKEFITKTAGKIITYTVASAQVNGENYATVEEAIAAAVADDNADNTVKLLYDITTPVTINETINLDLNGKNVDELTVKAGGSLTLSGTGKITTLNVERGASVTKAERSNVTVFAPAGYTWVNNVLTKTWDVTFKQDGQTDVVMTVVEGEAVAASYIPAIAGKTGYTGEWVYKNGTFTETVKITEDTAVTVKWTPITYTIEFNANGGTGKMDSIPATYDKAVTPENAFTFNGKYFAGWSTAADNTAEYPNGAPVENLTAAGGETVTLYAVWAAEEVPELELQAQTKTYNGQTQAFALNVSGYDIAYLQNGVAAEPQNAGTYDVKISKGTYEYVFEGGLDIKKVTLTARYVSEIIRVGRTPSLFVEVTGFVNDETAATAAGYKAPTVTTNATEKGVYTLRPSGGDATNYDFQYVEGTLTIKSKSSGGSSKPSTETGKEEKPEETPVETPEETPAETPAEEGVAQESVVLTIGNVVAMVDGMPVVNDVAPVIRNERTMLPIRFVAEALGADVAWDDDADKVTITKGDVVIEIFIGQPFALVNGNPVQLDAAAFIENGRTYLPLRFVAEVLGATVLWDANTNTVTIIPNK